MVNLCKFQAPTPAPTPNDDGILRIKDGNTTCVLISFEGSYDVFVNSGKFYGLNIEILNNYWNVIFRITGHGIQ